MWPLPSEQILGMVCGLSEPKRSNRHLLMLKAFIDDSGVGTHPIYALGGWIGPAKSWANFSDEWDRVLRMSPRIEYFKFTEAMSRQGQFAGISEERRNEKIKLLVDTIEEHELIGLGCAIPQFIFDGLFKEMKRPFNSPYFHSCLSLVGAVFNYFQQNGYSHKINFVFDDEILQIGQVLQVWQEFAKLASRSY